MRIVITGGTGGIGDILVEHLIKANQIVVISRTKDSLDRSIKKYGSKLTGYVCDVSDYEQVKDTFLKIKDFDALINCAGILGPIGNIEKNEIKEWENTIKVNLFGTVNCTKLAVPILKSKSNSKIINISGGGSAFPRVYHTAYAVSKTAVVRFTENLAKDLAYDNIKIDANVVAPGAYKTKMWEDETFDDEPKEWGDPRLLTELIDFLLSNKSNGITGKFLHPRDNYNKLDREISNSENFTLRRIDNFKFMETK